MQIIRVCFLTIALFQLFFLQPAFSEEVTNEEQAATSSPGLSAEMRLRNAKHPKMTLHKGPDALKVGEYIIIDSLGAVTRSLCPYSCSDRGLPAEHCKTWPSIQDPTNCYVQDTRLKTKVFE